LAFLLAGVFLVAVAGKLVVRGLTGGNSKNAASSSSRALLAFLDRGAA
jgi:hypothetical protein